MISSPTSVTALRPAPPGVVFDARDPGRDPVTRAAVAASLAAMPVLLPGGPGNLTPADGFALLAVGALIFRAGWTHERLRVPYLLGSGLLGAGGAISALTGDLPGSGLLAVTQDVFVVAWAAAVANFGRKPEDARFFIHAWALTASIWGVALGAWFGPSLLGGSAPGRVAFTFGEENAAGFYFVMSMLVIIAARRPRPRVLRAVALVFLGLATLGSGSLGAISGLLAGVAVAVVLGVRSRRGTALALALAVALPVGAGSVVLYSQRHQVVQAAHDSKYPLLRNSLGRGDQSSSSRTELASETFELWRTSDPLGRGPVTTEHELREQQAPYPKEAHNDWIAALVERGAIGVLGLVLLVGEIGLWAARTWNIRRLTAGFAAAVPAPHFVVGALGTALVFSLTHEALHDRTLWTFLGLLAAIGIWGYAPQGPRTGGTR